MYRAIGALCALLAATTLAAQTPDDEYYPYAEPEGHSEVLLTDSALFYRAVQHPVDRYGELTLFNLPQVARHRRGNQITTRYDNLPINNRYLTALRRLGAIEELRPDIRNIEFAEGLPLQPRQVAVWLTDRRYRVGARIATQETLGRSWQGTATVEMRTGRDLYVDGLFTHEATLGMRLCKTGSNGAEFSLLLIATPTMRGTQLSSTEEAFTITGNRHYNPAWGFQAGRARNSRVRRECVPLVLVGYSVPLTVATSFRTKFGLEAGIRKYSMLNWYDARTPMPDNYRYLPSYTQDRETADAWRSSDSHITQIDWDELIRQNRMAKGTVLYALEDRVERLGNFNFDLRFTTRHSGSFCLDYGLYIHRQRSRNYKQMRDLLDADQLIDIDQYLIDDATYRNMRQNDLRHPDRMIGEGDRFGYDYALTSLEAGFRGHVEYRVDRLRLDLDVEFGRARLFRRGYYEKELFAGAQSYGRSQQTRLSPYRLRVEGCWALSARQSLEMTLLTSAILPDAADLFYQPLYNNRTVDNPTVERHYAFSLAYRHTGRWADLYLTAFAEGSFDALKSLRYYDDMAALYCDMSISKVAQGGYGIELAADIRPSYRWQLTAAGSVGQFRYIRDPQITVLSDVDNTVVDSRATARMGGCQRGATPQYTACLEAAYFGAKGWGIRISTGYAGGRYVEPAPIRRTDRIAGQAGLTPESFAEFTRQERLEDAFTLDASLFKSFSFAHSRLTISLMLRNLTGENNHYDGYESLRVRQLYAGDTRYYAPQASRYTYGYSSSFYATIGYKF